MTKPIIFVSGPFRGKPNIEWNRQQNVRRAEAAALFVWRAGGIAICPHKNTEHFDGAADDAVFLFGDLQILERCDAILMVDGWGLSQGSCAELNFALDKNLTVLYSLAEAQAYIDEFTPPTRQAAPTPTRGG